MDQREIDAKLDRLCVRRPPGSCGLADRTDLADLAAIVRDQQARIAELERVVESMRREPSAYGRWAH